MGYLVCDKCGGYYELQSGESPDDFTDECECGGKTHFVESLGDVLYSIEEVGTTTICPKCGTENPEDAKLCKSCEKILKGVVSPPITDKTVKSSGFLESWKKQTKEIKAMSIIGVCCIGLILIVGIGAMLSPDQTSSNAGSVTQSTATQSTNPQAQAGTVALNNIQVTPGASFGDNTTSSTYDFSADLTPSKNYDYLHLVTKWYDSSGRVLNRDPMTWNTNSAKGGETYKVTSHIYLDGTPTKVVIMVFDTVYTPGDDSGAIFTTTQNL